MEIREKETRKENVKFDGNDISLAVKLVEKLSGTIDILYYLMNRGDGRSFVVLLVTAENVDLKEVLIKEKRDTDILFEIDEEESLYAVICQDTKIDGGYHFAQRVLQKMKADSAKNIYLTELEVRTTTHEIKYIIFKLLETFIKSKNDEKSGEIIFRSLTH